MHDTHTSTLNYIYLWCAWCIATFNAFKTHNYKIKQYQAREFPSVNSTLQAEFTKIQNEN